MLPSAPASIPAASGPAAAAPGLPPPPASPGRGLVATVLLTGGPLLLLFVLWANLASYHADQHIGFQQEAHDRLLTEVLARAADDEAWAEDRLRELVLVARGLLPGHPPEPLRDAIRRSPLAGRVTFFDQNGQPASAWNPVPGRLDGDTELWTALRSAAAATHEPLPAVGRMPDGQPVGVSSPLDDTIQVRLRTLGCTRIRRGIGLPRSAALHAHPTPITRDGRWCPVAATTAAAAARPGAPGWRGGPDEAARNAGFAQNNGADPAPSGHGGLLLWDAWEDAPAGCPAGYLAVLTPGDLPTGIALRAMAEASWPKLRPGPPPAAIDPFGDPDGRDAILLGVAEADGADPVIRLPDPALASAVAPVFAGGLRALERHGLGEPWIISWQTADGRRYLIAISPLPPPLPLPVTILFAAIATGWLVVLFRRPHWLEWGFAGRISGQLAFAFTLVAGIPTLLLLVVGSLATRARAANLLDAFTRQTETRLQVADDRLGQERRHLERHLDETLAAVTQSRDADEARARLTALASWAPMLQAQVVEGTAPGPTDPVTARDGIVPGPTRDRRQRYVHFADSNRFAAVMIEFDEPAWEHAIAKRIVGDFSLPGGPPVTIGFFPLEPPTAGQSPPSVTATIERRQPAGWVSTAPGTDRDLARVLPELAAEVRIRDRPVRRRIGPPRHQRCVVGIPGRHFRHLVPVAVFGADVASGPTGVMVIALIGLVGTMTLGFVVIGRGLARRFLHPLADIAAGVQAIARRHFSHHIPVDAPDELGDLARLMNRVIEDMHDLHVAAAVQERLFPAAPLRLGDCEIFGRSCPMIDIGGDYFDYFRLDDTRLVGLMGDVAGHGVAAALVMGMAKGAFAIDPHRSPARFLNEFNQLLLSNLQQRCMMTLCVFTLEIDTHRLTLANAGHSSPLHWQGRSGQCRWLEHPALPLGVWANPVYEAHEIELSHGDRLLFYTDGLVESLDPAGQPVGYPRAAEWLAEAASMPPREAVDCLEARFAAAVSGREPDDDVSLMVLAIDPVRAGRAVAADGPGSPEPSHHRPA